ncbi:hypothetical protein OSJ57_22050 [Sphingomonas sp. HH69]
MSKSPEKPHRRLSHPIDGIGIEENHKRLRPRHEHFLSDDFSLQIEYDATKHSEIYPNSWLGRMSRFAELNVALLILAVGFPMLIYCVITSN